MKSDPLLNRLIEALEAWVIGCVSDPERGGVLEPYEMKLWEAFSEYQRSLTEI